jgi:hypothetical protein
LLVVDMPLSASLFYGLGTTINEWYAALLQSDIDSGLAVTFPCLRDSTHQYQEVYKKTRGEAALLD